jgi:hypothetical protein
MNTVPKHPPSPDGFHKGAVEQESPEQAGNTCLRGQLGHRDQDPVLKAYDTDFPEPGENPEHTGEEFFLKSEPGKRKQDENETDAGPGQRRKENQNRQKDDPLAA